MKTPTLAVVFMIERWFFKGIHRKNKNMNNVFASILIPKCVFSKTKMQNILIHRIQFIMKIMIFRKIRKSYNTKTLWKQFREFWFFRCFDPKTPLQCHIRKFGKNLKSLWLVKKTEKSLWLVKKSWKNRKKHDFKGIFVKAITLWQYFDSTKNKKVGKVFPRCLEPIKIRFFLDYSKIWRELSGPHGGFPFFEKSVFTLPRAWKNIDFSKKF